MNTAILVRARELISDEKSWIQGVYARDKDHDIVDPSDPHAVCWCAAGAVCKAGTELELDTHITFGLLHEAAHRYGKVSIMQFNDMLPHAAVLGLFDEVIRNETYSTGEA